MPSDSISEHLFYWGDMPPDPPGISMLCMRFVLCTIIHTISHYTKRPHFKYMPLIREHTIIPVSSSLPYALLPGGSYNFASP